MNQFTSSRVYETGSRDQAKSHSFTGSLPFEAVLAGNKGTSRHSFTVSQVHRCWPHGRKRFAPHSQVHSFTGSQPIEAVLAENQGEGTREKGVGSKVQRLLLLAASPGIQAERSGATLIVSNIQGRRLRSGESGIPPGGRGGGGYPFCPLS